MRTERVWLFDLDDTLHDASTASMPGLHVSFGEYIQQHLKLSTDDSDALRRRYWQRYGATLLGLVKHHGVDAAHFLHHTHLLPGLEAAVRGHRARLRRAEAAARAQVHPDQRAARLCRAGARQRSASAAASRR